MPSLPLLYLILAEDIHAKAWLSMAPEHSFIIFSDNRNTTYYNYETTNGNCVTPDWLMESGYITRQSVQNRVYLDTLGQRELMATLVADLIMGYTGKFGYDEFMSSMVDSLLSLHPTSLQGQMFKADLLVLRTDESLKTAGNPPIAQIQNYPEANRYYQALLQQYEFIDKLGFRQMPPGIYERWLASLNTEQRRRETAQLKTQVTTNAKRSN